MDMQRPEALQPAVIEHLFEEDPIESATWLVCLDSFGALETVVKSRRTAIENVSEIAAKRLIKSADNNDYDTILQYVSKPEVYPPGMTNLVGKLGAITLEQTLDPYLNAALSYKLDEQPQIDQQSGALELYRSADSFPQHFADVAMRRLVHTDASLIDVVLGIKNDTRLWIDA